MTARVATPVVALAVLAVIGCGDAEPGPILVPEVDPNVETIADGPVAGEIGGAPFVARAVRLVRRRGSGRVGEVVVDSDERRLPGARLVFYAADDPVCGLPSGGDDARLWVALAEAPEVERMAIAPDDEAEAPAAHYEVPDGGRFRGVGSAAAVLTFDAVEARRVTGRLRACFADREGSCVEGRFEAPTCQSPIWGALRELQ